MRKWPATTSVPVSRSFNEPHQEPLHEPVAFVGNLPGTTASINCFTSSLPAMPLSGVDLQTPHMETIRFLPVETKIETGMDLASPQASGGSTVVRNPGRATDRLTEIESGSRDARKRYPCSC